MMRKFDTPLYPDQFMGYTAAEWQKLGIDTADVRWHAVILLSIHAAASEEVV
jgi:hypothetical protein